MKIAIMSALFEEIASLRHLLTDVKTETYAQREYHFGKFGHHEVILVFSKCGKVASALTAATLIMRYQIDTLIFTGVAGAAAKHLNIGDIVIGNEFYQHDMDPRPIFRKYEIPLTNKIFYAAEATLIAAASKAADQFVNEINTYIPQDLLNTYAIKTPAIHVGKIASGDLFVSDANRVAAIAQDMPDLLAIEMEGAAVAQVCFDHNVPFVIIRNISDRADHNAGTNCMQYLAEVAQHYSQGIIKNLLEGL